MNASHRRAWVVALIAGIAHGLIGRVFALPTSAAWPVITAVRAFLAAVVVEAVLSRLPRSAGAE